MNIIQNPSQLTKIQSFNNDIGFAAAGDFNGLIGVLHTLAFNSSDQAHHNIRPISFGELSLAYRDAAYRLSSSIVEDGFGSLDPLKLSNLPISMIHMVSGQLENNIIIARFPMTTVGNSYVEYVIDCDFLTPLIGKRFVFEGPEVVFLDYYISTASADPTFVCGNTPVLGNWNTEKALPLKSLGFDRRRYSWSIRIPMLKGKPIEFKFIQKPHIFESGTNRTFSADYSTGLNDNFRP